MLARCPNLASRRRDSATLYEIDDCHRAQASDYLTKRKIGLVKTMRRLMTSLLLIGGIAMGMLSAPASRGQVPQPAVVPVEWADEFHVNYVNGECTQSLSIPNTQARPELVRYYISYFRSEGCRWWPHDREMEGLRASLPVLLTKISDRAQVAGFFFGRVLQPEFRLRIANAALARHLADLPDERGFHRWLRSTVEAADVFKELRELFAEHGFLLSVGSLEKIERSREVELAQQGVDPSALTTRPPENARIPVGAIVWFDVRLR